MSSGGGLSLIMENIQISCYNYDDKTLSDEIREKGITFEKATLAGSLFEVSGYAIKV